MNGLDLFSGIGGIALALEPWVKTVAYCEVDRYAQGVILSRMRSGELARAPIWDDVRTLRGEMLPKIDVISGGFPCQDLSVAGKGAGLAGKRSGLFFEILRLVDECRPAFVFLENVPAIRTRGLEVVAEAFTSRGYDFRWTVLSAAEVGAPHLRKRWWGLATDTRHDRLRLSVQSQSKPRGKETADPWGNGSIQPLADSGRAGLQKLYASAQSSEPGLDPGRFDSIWGETWWAAEPDVGRVADGVPSRVDRIRCLGNSVVPLAARAAWIELMHCHGFEFN